MQIKKEKIKEWLSIIGMFFIFALGFYFYEVQSNKEIDQYRQDELSDVNLAFQSMDLANKVIEIENNDTENVFNISTTTESERGTYLSQALSDAKRVDIDSLNNIYSGFGDHYRDQFIAGLQQVEDGYQEKQNLQKGEKEVEDGTALLNNFWGLV